MELMMAMMVDQAKLQDEMFIKTGVENEIFEESLMHYVETDPDMRSEMNAYVIKMQEEMRKAGLRTM